MKLVYTGRGADFPPNQAKKLDARLARISKVLGRGEREAHVTAHQGALPAPGPHQPGRMGPSRSGDGRGCRPVHSRE